VIIEHFILLFQKIQVDFEGRSPVDADFHGIKQLLQQLFLKAHINLSELADLIIGQNYVGSVVKVRRSDLQTVLLHVSMCTDMHCFWACTDFLVLNPK
jgi:hypothetical protein